MRFEIGAGETGEADALTARFFFQRIETETRFRNRLLEMVEQFIRLRAVSAKGKEPHDLFIGIDDMEQIAVAIFPVSDDEAWCFQNDH